MALTESIRISQEAKDKLRKIREETGVPIAEAADRIILDFRGSVPARKAEGKKGKTR